MKIRGSRRFTPAGNLMPPSSISLYVLLVRKMTGGYNLRTSYRIIVTIFRRLKLSKSGLALPKWFNTSSLACSCHSGCMLSTISVQVSRTDVVSIPAK
uniref:Uncharacterized protein n=1 Tax=Arundo donax TaxID=35708 RepID=A0A0A9CX80_ARUDO